MVRPNHDVLQKAPKKYSIVIAMIAILMVLGLALFIGTRIVSQIGGLMSPPVPTECTDSDNGTFTEAYGSCADDVGRTFYDTCVITSVSGELQIQEYYCENNVCKSRISSCGEGFACAGGKCIKT